MRLVAPALAAQFLLSECAGHNAPQLQPSDSPAARAAHGAQAPNFAGSMKTQLVRCLFCKAK